MLEGSLLVTAIKVSLAEEADDAVFDEVSEEKKGNDESSEGNSTDVWLEKEGSEDKSKKLSREEMSEPELCEA